MFVFYQLITVLIQFKAIITKVVYAFLMHYYWIKYQKLFSTSLNSKINQHLAIIFMGQFFKLKTFYFMLFLFLMIQNYLNLIPLLVIVD